ncbi:histidinol dehydrogenase [Sphingomicrobium astaxanthinifaciens]|uniref:histidinol dehydrogenase n=1 Tax=Sphingomicrobium astaxanthinifaciens TaxID=1227949 RepID=UPI001FCC37AF|nr:histidinol dehydrogenase [Sphingomicrobium astaxanthinifaciens]MCJ7421207.1 histidinol dehydrogenase [Sphingomicrobium astaxanthinifaciens]
MANVIDWTRQGDEGRRRALARPERREDGRLQNAVREIIAEVRSGGWDKLAEIAERIDGKAPERVAVALFAERARAELPAEAIQAMRLAADNIERFHEATLPAPVSVETMPGLTVEKRWAPLASAGLYVPGGKAPLFSTLLMLAIPARVAGVERLTVVTPPRPEGGLDRAVALAAEMCGIEAVWTVGGAQAIAALAFGAGELEAVDRICGPGNAWVAAAKAQVASLPGGPGIDLPAGPSELLVIADETSDPARVAADLLSQAEHGEDAQVLLVSPSEDAIAATLAEVEAQAAAMGGDFAPARAIRCANLDEAVEIANAYAPEHLSIALADERAAALAEKITNAGAIFVGEGAAESFGDYLAGSSHVLPTDGAARYTGGVTALTYLKAISVQRIAPDTAQRLARPAAALARLEGLEAHARAADIRGNATKEAAE